MKIRKKTLALLLFSAGFICSVAVSAFVLWRTDVLNLPNQPNTPDTPVVAPVENVGMIYPAPNEDGLWGYINGEGEFVLGAAYQQALPFMGKAAWVQQNGCWGAIDVEGNFIVQPTFTDIKIYQNDGNSFVAASGNMLSSQFPNTSLYDVNGSKLFGLTGDLGEMSSGLMPFSRIKDEKISWGYINPHGEIIIEPIYAAVGVVSGNYALVQDFDGQTLLLNIYAQAASPITGAASLDAVGSRLVLMQREDGLYGYQDVSGSLVIDYGFIAAEPFRSGAALASTAEGTGLLTTEGVWAAEPIFDAGEYLGNGVYALRQAGQPTYLLVNALGEQIVPEPVYGYDEWQNGLLACRTADKTLFINRSAQLQEGAEFALQPNVSRLGQLYSVQDYNGMTWYAADGSIIYSAGRERDLTAGVKLTTVVENSSAAYLVGYPQVVADDEADNRTWRRLNTALAEAALGDNYDSYAADDELEFTVSGDYQLITCGRIMTAVQQLRLDDSWAAGGVEDVVQTVCFDAASGRQYSLADLFDDGVNWRLLLLEPARSTYTRLCAAAGVAEEPEMQSQLQNRLPRHVEFALGDEALTLYFSLSGGTVQPIEIAYSQIDAMIDKEGELWLGLQDTQDEQQDTQE